MPDAHRDAVPVEHGADIVRMHPVEVERQDAEPALAAADQVEAGDARQGVDAVAGQRLFMGADAVAPERLDKAERLGEADRAGDIRGAGLETVRRLLELGAVVGDMGDHAAAGLPRRHRRQRRVAAVEHAGAGRPVAFVAGEDVEIAADRPHVDRDARRCLAAVEQHQRPGVVRQAGDRLDRQDRAGDVGDVGEKVHNIINISSNLTTAAPLYNVQVDPQKAAAHGLTAQQVAALLREVYTGTTVTTVNFNGEQEDVNLLLGTPATTLADMQNLQLPAQVGQQTVWVKLGDVANVQATLGPTQITHLGGQRTATVSATATTNNVGSVNREIQRQIDALHLPAGVTVSAGGVAQSQAQAFSSLGIALLAAIMLVYLVMVAAFRSLVQPLILLVSIPFAATGSLLLMLATHTELGVPSLIGLLMLVGIVVTNAIVLLDLVRQYRARGMDARTAVIEGGRRRLRPILMTAVATILALLPMAFGLSKESGFIAAPLAITVIGGLTTSTILTLLLVPTLYVLVEGRKDRKPGSPKDEKASEQAHEEQESGTQAVVQGA